MSQTLTITQLGKTVGLPSKTIRFYEEIGLIPKADRAENGYRLYQADTLNQLKYIKAARDLDLPISQIRKLMIGCEGKSCEHTKKYIQEEIENYQEILEKKIQQFQTLQRKLNSLHTKIDACSTTNTGYCCNILQQLAETEGGE
jgi:DNA-binding transcriptional MerR regulator